VRVAAMSTLSLRLLEEIKEQQADSTDGSTFIPGSQFGCRCRSLAVSELRSRSIILRQ
jgi:uncharacterized protein with gpF-like domain